MKMKRTVRMPLRRAPQRTRPPASSSLRARAATADEAYDDEEDYGGEEEPNMKLSHAFMVVLVLHVIAVIGVFAFNSIKAGQTAAAKSATPVPAAESTVAKESAPAPAAVTTAAAPASTLDGWKGKTHTVAANETLSRIATTYKTTIEALEKENGITSYSVIRVGQTLKIPGTAPAKVEAAKETAAKQAFIATKTENAKPSEDVIPLTTGNKPAPVKAAQVEPSVVTSKPAPAPVVKPAPAPAAPAGDGVYVVAKGDNPYSIAKKLHVSYNDLIAANDIKDPTKIQIGQKLKVPTKNQ